MRLHDDLELARRDGPPRRSRVDALRRPVVAAGEPGAAAAGLHDPAPSGARPRAKKV